MWASVKLHDKPLNSEKLRMRTRSQQFTCCSVDDMRKEKKYCITLCSQSGGDQTQTSKVSFHMKYLKVIIFLHYDVGERKQLFPVCEICLPFALFTWPRSFGLAFAWWMCEAY